MAEAGDQIQAVFASEGGLVNLSNVSPDAQCVQLQLLVPDLDFCRLICCVNKFGQSILVLGPQYSEPICCIQRVSASAVKVWISHMPS
jgi:hypothetical protein